MLKRRYRTQSLAFSLILDKYTWSGRWLWGANLSCVFTWSFSPLLPCPCRPLSFLGVVWVPCSWPVPPLVVWFWVPLLCGLCAALPRLLAPVTLLLCSGLLWGLPSWPFCFFGCPCCAGVALSGDEGTHFCVMKIPMWRTIIIWKEIL